VATKLARAAGATAVGVTAGFVGGAASPAASSATNVRAAEQVASEFVTVFEGFSYRNPTAKARLDDLATAPIAFRLSTPSQAATGPGLAAEQFTVTATVVGFEVEVDAPATIELLARTDVDVSTTAGSSSSVRLIPVSLALFPTGWKVSAIDGLNPSPSAPRRAPPTTVSPPAVTSTTPTDAATPGSDTAGSADGTQAPVVTTVGDIPAAYLADMQAAVAARCPGLSWTVLAGIGKVESDFGTSTLPGVSSGANRQGAEGPMQFEPATFAAYGIVAPGGADPASPYDPADAIFSAASLLCADGGGHPAQLYSAIFDYNHSDAYVTLVLAYADEYGRLAAGGSASPGDERGLGSVIVADAESYLGTPYVWGGENPRTGFDCSGLVQWVYAQAGLSLPRVAQDQYDAGPRVPTGAPLYPGDLVFFGSGPSGVDHVGIYVGNGTMIDAPDTGAVVRFDRVASVPLPFVGATRPEIPDLTTGAGVPVLTTYVNPSGGSHVPPTDGHRGAEAGHRPPGAATHHGVGRPPGSPHSGRHHPTTTTSTTAPTTTRPTPTTTPHSGRHHRTTTTTTTPPTTSTIPATPPTTTTPTTTTPTLTIPTTTSTTTGTAVTAPTTPTHPGRHHR
jgi:cell wall-associated NlpC family hydrolase